MRERKILIIVENLPVPFDTRVWQEAVTLAENGYTVSVICPKGGAFTAPYERLEGVHIYRHDLPPEGKGFWSYLREYAAALREEYRLAQKVWREVGFQVIHGCNPPDDIFLIARRFRRKGVGYVFDHHDICPELFQAKFGKRGLLYKGLSLLERLNYQSSAFAFVTNESYRRIALDRGGMDPERVMVLRSGPRLERLRLQPPVEALKRGRRYMVGYVGVIGRQEGLDYLLEAARYLKGELGRADVCWAVVGGGPYLEEIKGRCTSMGLEGCVEFTGRVSDQILLDYLNTADVCVNPDEYNEMNDKSTMNKILEYMALGKPIVQFDLTEGRRSAGTASLYAAPNDAVDLARKIAALLDDPEQREKMGAYGRERILRELGWEQTSRALLEGYDRVFRELEEG